MIEGFVSPQALALLFLFFGLTIAVLVKNLRSKYSWVPYTPTLFLVSVGLGYFSKDIGIIGQSIGTISQIDPRGILLIFLPPLIFESAFNSDWYVFRKQAMQIFILAFPAVLVGASIIMFSIKAIIQYDDNCYTWPQAFMFGSVLSCTDTVAVLALLKQAGAPRKFNSLIQGESLLNDGSCMILFTISLELVKGKMPPVLYIGQLFFQLTIGAVVLGCVIGFISAQLIARVRNNSVLTLNITVVSCYLIYFIAEYVYLGIKISGIMSLVSLGLYMAAFGKSKIAPQANELVQNFWKIFVFVAQTIIFIMGGVLVGIQFNKPQFILVLSKGNIIKLFYLYIFMTLARFLAISLFMPKLRTIGYGLKWKEVGALTYGGLRGAVGIAFTLILASNPRLNPTFRMISLFNTSGCAFLTLMINAPTCNFVIRKMGLCVKSQIKIKFFGRFMSQCDIELNRKLNQLKQNKYLENANWNSVQFQSGLPELKQFIIQNTARTTTKQIISEKEMKILKQNLLSENIPQQVDNAIMGEVRNRFCVILKGIISMKFQDNQCSTQSDRMLIECVNLDMDSLDEQLNSWDYLSSYLHNSYFFPICYWLKSKPIIGPYAYAWMYDRVGLLYDTVSTYIQSLKQCEQACKNLPYDEYLQEEVIKQSKINRKYAQTYLTDEIKKSYVQIMKRIQTTKAAQSLLSYQKQILEHSYQFGQINETFHTQILDIIENCINNLEKDSAFKEDLSQIDILKQNEFFQAMSSKDLNKLLSKKTDMLLQKDEAVTKSYEKNKFIYLVARGELIEQYKNQGEMIYQKVVGFGQLAAVGIFLLNHKKQLQFSAVAQSVVSLFCFPVSEIKEIISNKTRLQQLLYHQIFLLQIRIEPDLKKQFDITESEWRKRKAHISFKKLGKQQVIHLQNCEIIMPYGKITLNNGVQHHKGHFTLKDQITAKASGPAKIYILDLEPLAENQKIKQIQILNPGLRASFVRHSRASSKKGSKAKDNSVLRRTLYAKI